MTPSLTGTYHSNNSSKDMEKIRINNTFEVRWAIFTGKGVDVTPYDLTGKNLTLYLANTFGKIRIDDFAIDGHILTFTWQGKDQKRLGAYSMTLIENEGESGMRTVDECDAFELVRCSCMEGGASEGRVECTHLQFRSVMSVGGSGSSGPVDTELNAESGNAIANSTVTAALNDIYDRIDYAEGLAVPHAMNEDFNSDFAI